MTTAYLWCDGHSISISIYRVCRVRVGVQVSRREFCTHIYLTYARVEFLSYILKKKKLIKFCQKCWFNWFKSKIFIEFCVRTWFEPSNSRFFWKLDFLKFCLRAWPNMFKIQGLLGNVILIMLFIFFGNTCGWKSVWKYM